MARYVCSSNEVTLHAPGPRKGKISVRFVRNPASRCIVLRAEQETLFADAIAEHVRAGVLIPADQP